MPGCSPLVIERRRTRAVIHMVFTYARHTARYGAQPPSYDHDSPQRIHATAGRLRNALHRGGHSGQAGRRYASPGPAAGAAGDLSPQVVAGDDLGGLGNFERAFAQGCRSDDDFLGFGFLSERGMTEERRRNGDAQ
jgi:hypothetical protein